MLNQYDGGCLNEHTVPDSNAESCFCMRIFPKALTTEWTDMPTKISKLYLVREKMKNKGQKSSVRKGLVMNINEQDILLK